MLAIRELGAPLGGLCVVALAGLGGGPGVVELDDAQVIGNSDAL